MKQIIGVFLIIITLCACSQKKKTNKEQKEPILIESKIDKRVELLSIVFRLADSPEYSQNLFPAYIENIETHFEKFKSHDLIKYVKDELRKDGVGFSSVMSMAIHITEPPNMRLIVVPFSNKSLEESWSEENSIKFLKLLNEFYTDADCETFFKDNSQLYQTASKNFATVYQYLDLQWYQKFYGTKPKGEFRIIVGLGNGGANYGPKIIMPNGKEEIFAIMGTWSVDSIGMPKYDAKDYFPTILHEFNHSFVNHVVEKYRLELEKSGTIIFNNVKDEMHNQGYGNWKTMFDEVLVRASVIKYMKDHDFDKKIIENELKEQLESGFFWMDELIKELEKYDNAREAHPTFESYMKRLVIFHNKIASGIEKR